MTTHISGIFSWKYDWQGALFHYRFEVKDGSKEIRIQEQKPQAKNWLGRKLGWHRSCAFVVTDENRSASLNLRKTWFHREWTLEEAGQIKTVRTNIFKLKKGAVLRDSANEKLLELRGDWSGLGFSIWQNGEQLGEIKQALAQRKYRVNWHSELDLFSIVTFLMYLQRRKI